MKKAVAALAMVAIGLVLTWNWVQSTGEVFSHRVVTTDQGGGLDSTYIVDDGIGAEDLAPGAVGIWALDLTGDTLAIHTDTVKIYDTLWVEEGIVLGDSLSLQTTATHVHSTLDVNGAVDIDADVDISGYTKIAGDSLSVASGSFYNWADTVWTLGGCSGVATLTAAADSVLVTSVCATADSSTSAVWFTVLNPAVLVGTIFRNYQIDGAVEFESTGNETTDIYIQYKIERIAK